jgi:hypothetical protein
VLWPSQKITARDLNTLAAKSECAGRLCGNTGLATEDTPGGPLLRNVAPWTPTIWVQLVSISGTNYGWREVTFDPASRSFSAPPGGRSSDTSTTPAVEINYANDLTAGSIVEIGPSPDGSWYWFLFHRYPTSQAIPCGAPICVRVGWCFGSPPASTVSITDPHGHVICTGSTDSSGKFCCTPPSTSGSGTYTATVTHTCPNYLSPASATFAYDCRFGGGVTISPAIDPSLWTSGTYVINGCCNCCTPCTGRPAFKIPRTLYLTLTGPVEIFGTYNGAVITLTLAGDSADPASCPNTGLLHYTSGCLSPSGTWGGCYYTDCCGQMIGGVCTFTWQQKRDSSIDYGGCSADVWFCGSGPPRVRFENFWNGDCTNSPPPGCAAGKTLYRGRSVDEAACGCAIPGVCDSNPRVCGLFPAGVDNGSALGFGCTAAGSYSGSTCGPVNARASGYSVRFLSSGICATSTNRCDGTIRDVSWGFILTE